MREVRNIMVTRVVLVTLLAVLTEIPTRSQERFSFFAASSQESVERMLTLAKLQDTDVVVDLGSGNGVIPLTAARMNPRLRGRGVEIDSKLVEQSNQRAKSDGVAERVRFEHGNAFDVDLRDATVVTMWLYPELMRLLRPVILERAAPGTRVLTSTWDLGSWQADEVDNVDVEGTAIYMWIVPARVAGAWEWELSVANRRFRYSSFVEQHFQKVEGVARTDDRREVLEGMTLRGAEITFALNITLDGFGLTRHEFSGKVENDQIVGTVKITPAGQSPQTLPWRARRSERSDYFARTSADVRARISQ
jgi:methyltransferase family protein